MASRFFAATAPSATTTLGLTTAIWRMRNGEQVSHLVALRRAIAGRTAFHDVGDVDILAANAHGFDHVVEQLSGAAHEGLALRVFVGAGAFAHEHQVGARIAHAEDDLLAALLVQFAAGAVAEVFANEFERGDGIGDGLLRHAE